MRCRTRVSVMGLGVLSLGSTLGAQEVVVEASDGVRVHGERYFADLEPSAPLLLLFHQGGSNGRAEYGPLVPWVNGAGYRVVAWDQRAGGAAAHGGQNRTRDGLPTDAASDFCGAYADLEAALAASEDWSEGPVVVWGSSYSGSLVFRLAAEHPDAVAGVIAFSPASGGPMRECRARMWIDEIRAEAIVFRPESEMARGTSVEQAELLRAAGVGFVVVEGGVHGASMLVDERTDRDMGDVRARVLRWLQEVYPAYRRDQIRITPHPPYAEYWTGTSDGRR